MKTFTELLVIFFLLTLNGFIWLKVLKPEIKQSEVLSASTASFIKQTFNSPQSMLFESKLPEIVTTSLEGTTGTYSVGIRNLKTGEKYYLNEDRPYDAGSLYKLWIMGAVYKKIEAGEIKEDEELARSISYLNKLFGISPEDAELTEGGIDMTVSEALNQMITISHNYAALLLTEKVKLSEVKTFLEENHFDNSSVGVSGEAPKTTVKDVMSFFEKLYNGQLASPENTQKMLTLLKNQKKNNKLPKYLPEGTLIGHKTGEIGWFSHDAGIIFSDKGDYIIAVLSETDNPAGAEDRIGKISKSVFDEFIKN